MSEAITVLLALEARDKATQILEQLVGKLKNVETSVKAAAAASTRSTADIEAANMRAAASAASYDRAVAAQAVAQKGLREAMLASKAAQLEADAAIREGGAAAKAAAAQVTEAATAEEAALVRLQQAEKLVATRSTEMAAAQEAASTKTGKGAAALKGVAVAAGATAIAVGVIGEKSIKAAGDFEASTNRLVTSAGETHANIEMVRQGMLQMAGDVGYSTEQLAQAMYKVESGGQHGAAGLQVLRAAAEGAKAENASLETVADAVTSALVDYHLKASDAAEVTSKMVAATSAGKTTFEQLSGSFSAILPVASAAGVSLNDILGDLASMTVHGMSAQQAAQNLADTIRHMQNPTAVQAKELALLGLTTNQLASDLKTKGLSGTLNEISDRITHLMPPGTDKVVLNLKTALNGLPPAVRDLGVKVLDGSISMKEFTKQAKDLNVVNDKQVVSFATLAGSMHRIGDQQMTGSQVMQSYGAALAKATGDATGLNTTLMLSGENAGVTANAIKTVSGATTEAGNHVKGWSDIQSTFNYKMAALKGHLEGAKIAIGTGLLPVVSSLADKVMKVVTPVTDWMTKHEKLTGIILGSIGALGGLVATGVVLAKTIEMVKTAMVALRIATIAEDGALAANPIGIVVIALVALGVALYEAYKHSETFRKIVQGAWEGIKTAAEFTWNHVLKPAFEGIKSFIMDKVVPAALFLWHNALEPAFRAIGAVAMWLWHTVLKPAFDAFKVYAQTMAQVYLWLWHNAIEPALKAIGAVAVWLWHNVIEPVWDGIKVAISVAWDAIKVIWDLLKGYVSILGDIFHWLWKDVIQPVWQGIQLAISIAWAVIQVIWGIIQIEIKILADVFTWLWHNVLEPVWHGISDVISWAWHNIIKPLWDAFKLELHILGDVLSWFYNNVVSPVWHAIGDAISFVWRDVIKPVFNFFASIIKDQVQPAFKAGVDALGAIWHGIIDVAKTPVRFVVNTVLNDGLLAGYNKLASLFGVKPDNVHIPLPSGFAAGGQIPGVPSTKDNMLAMVATGEHIMPTERTQKWLPVLESIRLHDKLPGFADGGLVGLLAGPANWVRNNFGGGVGQIASKFGNSPYTQALVGMGHKFLDSLVHKAEDMVKHLFSGGGGSNGAGGGQLDQWIATALAVLGLPASWAGPMHTLVMRESGGRTDAVNRSDINWLNGTPSVGLAQVIGPTFAAYAGAFRNVGPFLYGVSTDPIANLVASLSYIRSVYGSIFSVQQAVGATPKGYAAGGPVGFGNVAVHDRGGPIYPGWNAIYNGTGGMEYTADPRGGAAGQQVYIDLRESKFMSDRDIDVLLDKLDKRLVRTMLPGAGVQVRR